ncbi:MAG: hypothetical protein WD529_05705 [Balneolaceae bacterium]
MTFFDFGLFFCTCAVALSLIKVKIGGRYEKNLPPPPPPLTADIDGPQYIDVGTAGMFTVDVNNEEPPVEYLWYKEKYEFGQPTGVIDTLHHWNYDYGYYPGQNPE